VKVEQPGRGSRFDVGTVVRRTDDGRKRRDAIAFGHEVVRIIEAQRKESPNG
jgi:hypothetical protein